MKSKRLFLMLIWFGTFGALFFLLGTTSKLTATADDSVPVNFSLAPSSTITVPITAQSWMMWQPNQYALAEDSQSLWIGASGALVRWDKEQSTYQRYTLLDGLPHHAVYAIAVDSVGNRWFGGDHGISQLDANNVWTHFNVANSGLYSNLVDGIAIGADDTLWLSHGLPAGSVSRRDPDGSWHWFPSRVAAVAADYLRIHEVRNANKLWTVAGNEIWVGYYVYDGSTWVDRRPGAMADPTAGLVADSGGHIWVGDGPFLSVWDGSGWSNPMSYNPVGRLITTLAVGPGDAIWVGGTQDTCGGPCGPARRYIPFWINVKNESSLQRFDKSGSVTALLPITNSVWAMGSGWLSNPDGTIYDFADLPTYSHVTDILAGSDNLLWMHSQTGNNIGEGAIQILDDQGTTSLVDDTWSQRSFPNAESLYNMSIGSFERTPLGDLWAAANLSSLSARRHGDTWIKYQLPPLANSRQIVDIFAQDEHHTWFAFAEIVLGQDARPQGVVALDDRGTPENLSDDVWTEYPIVTPDGTGGAVVVDTFGQPWFGNSKGIYRYDGTQWQPVNDYSYPGICDLVPADSGILFAIQAQIDDCAQLSESILQIETDGSVSQERVDTLVEKNLNLVRSAVHRNRLWTIAPDDAVWYTVSAFRDQEWTQELQRRDNAGLTIYALPFSRENVRRLEVDQNDHAWIVAEEALWRMSPTPDFVLRTAMWLLTPGGQRSQQIHVASLGGYQAPVTVTLSGLPSGITATLEPTVVQAGDDVMAAVSVEPGTPLGDYTATLIGASIGISHTTSVTLSVVEHVYDNYFPIIDH